MVSLRPTQDFAFGYDLQNPSGEKIEKFIFFSLETQNEKLFRLHKQFFSVIDWQKVESGFQAFQKNWNLFFSLRLLFRKSVLYPFALSLFPPASPTGC